MFVRVLFSFSNMDIRLEEWTYIVQMIIKNAITQMKYKYLVYTFTSLEDTFTLLNATVNCLVVSLINWFDGFVF